ncbi:MAG: hypothetical protein IKE73_01235 [Bacilli bacterium]|nr:hypothetical protein [Bacilli bacterium]
MVKEILKKIDDCESKINYESNKEGYLEELVHSYPILSLNEERVLFNLYKTTKDKTYKDIIFKCYLRDVYDTCTVFNDVRADLISEGTILLYEFIDNYDYRIPYNSFRKVLQTRLKLLYEEKINDNNNSLDSKMSIKELINLEKRDKCLTDTDVIEEPISEEKEELIIVKNYSLEEPKYLLSYEEAKHILYYTLIHNKGDIPNKQKKHKIKKYKPSDMDY